MTIQIDDSVIVYMRDGTDFKATLKYTPQGVGDFYEFEDWRVGLRRINPDEIKEIIKPTSEYDQNYSWANRRF